MSLKRVCNAFATIAVLTAALSFSSFAFSAQGGKVTANGSLNMRSQASLSASVLAKLPTGSSVLVLDDAGDWYKVAYHGMVGFVSDDYLTLSSAMNIQAGYAKVTTGSGLRLRSGPGTSYAVLTTLSKGTTAEIIGVNNGWIKVNYKSCTGYLSAEYITVVSTDESGDTSSSSGSLKVTSSGKLRMRSGPGTSYSIITSLSPGTVVKNLGTSGSWYKVQHGDYVGYVSGDYVTPVSDTASSYDGIKVTSNGRLNMRSGAGTSYSIVTTLPSGAVAKLISTHSNWYKVTYNGYTGFVSADYCQLVDYDAAVSVDSIRESVVAYAKTFLGTKYVYGGNTPETGFDCSGFVKYVLAEYGYSIPRTSASQYSATARISKSELKLGDLIFFGSSGTVSHVGMYIGENNFIHAENSTTGVCISSLSSSYYTSHYIGCGRVIG